jgi:2-phosphosulfolactate phosphatase
MKIHVLLKKEELDAQRLPGKTVVVLDILFATSSIVAAMAHGAAEVIPTLDGAAAQAEAACHPADSCVLSGELNADTLPGFVHPTPLLLGKTSKARRWSTPPPTARWRSPSRARPTTSTPPPCSTARR